MRSPRIPARRLTFLTLIVAVSFAAVVVRLVEVQALGRRKEVAYGDSELIHTVAIPAPRGTIYDREGQILAMSVATVDIVADPHQVSDPRLEATRLAPLLAMPVGQLRAELSQDAGFVYLARQITTNQAAAVSRLGLAGVTQEPDSTREYPDGSLLASLVGGVNAQAHGISGLEYQYDSLLSGRPGQQIIDEGANGVAIPGGTLERTRMVPGTSLDLTVDAAIQYETEQQLAAEMSSTHAKKATALVLSTKTGAILAAVGLKEGPGGSPVPSPVPIALTDVYEPGSVMKLPTYAEAIAGHLITPSTPINVPAQLDIGGDVFHDAEAHPDETLTATQCLDQSSNICTIEVAEKLGAAGLYNALRTFGFGQAAMSFPGMSQGLLNPVAQWSGTALGSTAIGQDEAANLLQLADAYGVVANGGIFVAPSLVAATVGPDGRRVPETRAQTRRVVNRSTAQTVTSMLEGVVSTQGTAPGAAIPGYTVAGKTGTAQIPNPNGTGYLPGAFSATFVGFAPAQDPAVTVVVDLTEPDVIYGGSVAAPVAAHILSYVLHRFRVPPPVGTFSQGAGSSVNTGPTVSAGLPSTP